MIKKHTPESIQQAIFLTLSQIQNVIYDFWNADVPWSQAQKELQRHALELRLLDRPDIPQTIDPLRYARSAARAIERANAARDRIRADVQTSRLGMDQAAAGGTAAGPDHHGPDMSVRVQDDEQVRLDKRTAVGDLLDQTSEPRMTYGDDTLEEGSADVGPDDEPPLQVGAARTWSDTGRCISCGVEFEPGSRGRAAGGFGNDGRPYVICLDCYGKEPPRAVP